MSDTKQNEQAKNLEAIRKKLGKIHIYAGDGKGKTTAAVGLSVRASGAGLKVLFVQFLKSGNSAELDQLRKLGVDVITGQPVAKFTFMMGNDEKDESADFFAKRLEEAFRKAEDESYDLLVLDEIFASLSSRLVSEEKLIQHLHDKPEHLEVALTGRDPSEEVIAESDYYSEIVMRKHPYESEGITARRGIEF